MLSFPPPPAPLQRLGHPPPPAQGHPWTGRAPHSAQRGSRSPGAATRVQLCARLVSPCAAERGHLPPPTHTQSGSADTELRGRGGGRGGDAPLCAGGIPAPGVASKSPQSLHSPPPAAHPPWKRLLLHRFLLHPWQRHRSQPHTDPAAAPSKLIASGSGALKGDGGGSRSRAGGCAMQSSSHGGPRPGASGRSSQQDAHPHSFLLLQPLARRSHTKILLCRMHRFTTRGLRRPPPIPEQPTGPPTPTPRPHLPHPSPSLPRASTPTGGRAATRSHQFTRVCAHCR